jgi:single-strand DNA-binding protein
MDNKRSGPSLNKVQLIGNVTDTPKVREVASGSETTKVANFSIATNKSWKDKAGKVQEEVEYTPIVLWRQLAELAEKYVTKGKKVYVEGALKTSSYEKDGVKHFKTEVVGNNVIFLSQNGDRTEASVSDEGKLEVTTTPATKKTA